jgi:hypothetical protein
MDLARLAEPFREDEYEWRVGQSGSGKNGPWAKVLCYVTARAVMDRLDETVGPENWRVSYTHIAGGVMCALSIRCGDEWVTKQDGAENTDIEAYKGGISGALKRAAVAWGIGRFLYNLDEGWAECSTDPRKFPHYAKTKDGTPFSWAPPALPSWALPAGTAPAAAPPPPPPDRDRPFITDAQLKRIHALRRELEIPEKAYRAGLKRYYDVTSTKDLDPTQASELIARLEAKRRSDVDDDVSATFGDGRLGKLRKSALGFLATAERMKTYKDGSPVDLKRAGLVCDTFGELREVVQAMGEEKELEDVVTKLEKLLEEMSF